ncbi:Uncharacterised protein [Mycobacteroides abscessus subsp. abscessus]|nr:Uncharacterised protein [Mycobacteroides abscessus subsp. abscessus]
MRTALFHLGLGDLEDLLDDHIGEVVEQSSNGRIGDPRLLARLHQRVVVREGGRGTAHHSVGELLGSLFLTARREVVGELIELGEGVTDHLREYRVLAVEVEVEPGSTDACPLTDRADREVGEAVVFRDEFGDSRHDRVPLAIAAGLRATARWTDHLHSLHRNTVRTELDTRQVLWRR